MKLVFALYIMLGLGTGLFIDEQASKATVQDWLILVAINSPLILLTVVGALVANKGGDFFGMPLPIWLIACVGMYGIGISMYLFM